ncbi:hypothetical protein GLOTRDRAFT_34274 [Gloeophyllum trabeum ATCC 11539]|uniref:F-box domain-containing protein n=1 Tax=Gloeophyllum trabeum (strain ATCC 11539 / FP-39264 / Madison 617) TaxID=670483 RepID=S7RVL0_GLOTA|nr:uncharacterized protein GLOTRDRAFT_34274 [Gloeophyllum trabeum ATCC 11539]EPQ58840.1 hypothetical protein GLOTRDRAFT_34274 [Gloeophyllum trabeum ATCC 11539]
MQETPEIVTEAGDRRNVPQLPIELYQEVIGHIESKSDLCAISVVSRAVQALAESLIYHTVESRRRCRTQAFCKLVVECPRIGSLVRSLIVANDERHGSYPALPPFWDNMGRALQRMPHLEILRVHDGFTNPNARILRRCTFSLRELSSDFALDGDLIAFLETQRRITSIDWTDTDNAARTVDPVRDTPSPGQGALPQLQLLHTDSLGMAMRLVPGRPVTHLWVSNEANAMYEEFITAISRSTGPLLSLRMGFPFHKGSIDREIMNALAAFKDLRTLVLWNMVTPDTLRSLESACPSLRVVACLHYSYAYEYIRMPVNPIGTPQPMHDPDFSLWKDV